MLRFVQVRGVRCIRGKLNWELFGTCRFLLDLTVSHRTRPVRRQLDQYLSGCRSLTTLRHISAGCVGSREQLSRETSHRRRAKSRQPLPRSRKAPVVEISCGATEPAFSDIGNAVAFREKYLWGEGPQSENVFSDAFLTAIKVSLPVDPRKRTRLLSSPIDVFAGTDEWRKSGLRAQSRLVYMSLSSNLPSLGTVAPRPRRLLLRDLHV